MGAPRNLGFALALGIAAFPLAAADHPLAELCLPAGVVDRALCLEEGRWEGEPFVAGGAARPSVELLAGAVASADLDGDGTPEIAGLLAASGAGTGSDVHLVVARSDGESLRAIATVSIGDRVQVRDLAAVEGVLHLAVVRHDADDAMCCPTEKAELVFALRDGGLELLEESASGAISIADLEGVTWRLTRLGREEPAPESPQITLVVERTRLSGSSGCNRYLGSVREPAPRRLEIGPLAGTRRLCQERENELEARYLAALGAVDAYSFLGGELVLAGTEPGGGTLALHFSPVR